MKLKKKPKRILIIIIVIAALAAIGFVGYNIFFGQPEVQEAKVIKKIDKYGKKQSDLRPFGYGISQPAYLENFPFTTYNTTQSKMDGDF